MVDTIRHRRWHEAGETKIVVIGVTSAAAVAVIAYAMNVQTATLTLMLFHVAALTLLGAAWHRATEASQAAIENAHHLDFLADRLTRLEQQTRVPNGGSPVLRSTMAEVTGTVGLLGGVVRELARNVAAQHRDVADIKDSLQHSGARDSDRPALKIVPERRPAVEPVPATDRAQPEPSLLPVRPIESESELRRTRLVTQAFEADRIELHLQPVVSLPQRKVRFYEALARLRLDDGTLLAPGEFLSHLERIGRAPELDRRVLHRAIAVAQHLMKRGSEAIVSVNLSPRSVRDADFLSSVEAVVGRSPEIAGKIVLELSQACWRSLDGDRRSSLRAIADRGLPLSLDQAPDLVFDPRALSEGGIRFLKLPAEMLIAAGAGERDAEMSVRDFASILRMAGIRLVADRVEHDDMVPALVDLGIPLAQGFAFAAPRAVRGEVLGRAGAAKGDDLRRVG